MPWLPQRTSQRRCPCCISPSPGRTSGGTKIYQNYILAVVIGTRRVSGHVPSLTSPSGHDRSCRLQGQMAKITNACRISNRRRWFSLICQTLSRPSGASWDVRAAIASLCSIPDAKNTTRRYRVLMCPEFPRHPLRHPSGTGSTEQCLFGRF